MKKLLILVFVLLSTMGFAQSGTFKTFDGNIQTSTETVDLRVPSQMFPKGAHVEIGAGTAAAPSLTTAGDLNTGIYFPAADTVGVSAGGVQVATFSASGGVFPFATAVGNPLTALFETPNSGGTSNQYYKFARVTLPYQYAYQSRSICVLSGGNSNGYQLMSILGFHIKQQLAFGNNPSIQMHSLSMGHVPLKFGYVVVDNSGPTVVDLYVLNPLNYNTLMGFDMGGVRSNGVELTFYSGTAYEGTSQPAGYVAENDSRLFFGHLTLSEISSPPPGVKGRIFFNSTDNHFYGYNGTAWVQLDN